MVEQVTHQVHRQVKETMVEVIVQKEQVVHQQSPLELEVVQERLEQTQILQTETILVVQVQQVVY